MIYARGRCKDGLPTQKLCPEREVHIFEYIQNSSSKPSRAIHSSRRTAIAPPQPPNTSSELSNWPLSVAQTPDSVNAVPAHHITGGMNTVAFFEKEELGSYDSRMWIGTDGPGQFGQKLRIGLGVVVEEHDYTTARGGEQLH